MAPVRSVSVDTNLNDDDQDVDALLEGVRWDIESTGNVITYSFPTSAGQIGYVLSSGAIFSSRFSNAQQNTARDAMDMVESYTNIDFQSGTDSGATVRWFNVTGIGTAFGYFPNSGESGGDMAYLDGAYTSNLSIGTYETTTFMHELGHALGLKHGHENSCCCAFCAADEHGPMPTDKDSMEYSLMTYRSYVGHDLDSENFYTNADGSYAQTYMISDIAALQRMYGANYSTNSGDSVYTFNEQTGAMSINGVSQGKPKDNVVFRAVWDGGGNDTYDFTTYDTDMLVDLRAGAYSDFDVGGNAQRAELNFGVQRINGDLDYSSAYEVYADGHLYNAYKYEGNVDSLIENVNGGRGNDVIIGNMVENVLKGKGGVDKLNGLGGKDTIYGGSLNDKLKGGAHRDKLYGENGDDILFGGKGKDLLNGGKGDDYMVGGEKADVFVFLQGDGNDVIRDFNDDGDDSLNLVDFDLESRQAALDLAMQSGDDVVINLGGGATITLLDTDVSSLTLGDFIV